ncbi:MAG: PEP-CTERM sorting domain-containing protein [Bryobacteraceae bacterium]|nr:PEP-CTERM sorting domain-containing protein [Bryobacteraceae bacterium]
MRRTVSGLGKWALRIAAMAAAASCLGAADFSFSTIIRAGGILFLPDWELGIGPAGNPSAIQGNLGLFNYYPNGAARPFQIQYTRATNRAVLTYNGATSVTYAPGGPGLAPGSVWTIPAGSLFVSASSRPVATSVTISGLTLGGGVTVLQPFSATTLTASQLNSNMMASLGSPVVFRTGPTGDWTLSGTIAFTGLRIYTFPLFNGAAGSELSMGAGISGSDVPEPASWLLTLAGAASVGGAKFLRRSRRVRA